MNLAIIGYGKMGHMIEALAPDSRLHCLRSRGLKDKLERRRAHKRIFERRASSDRIHSAGHGAK